MMALLPTLSYCIPIVCCSYICVVSDVVNKSTIPDGNRVTPAWWANAVSLHVESDPPGATIHLNGFRIVDADGHPLKTPCTVPHLRQGTYVLECWSNDGQYGSCKTTVTNDPTTATIRLRRTTGKRRSNRPPESIPRVAINDSLPVPEVQSPTDCAKALRALFGPRVPIADPRPGDRFASVQLDLSRFDDLSLALFAPVAGRWSAESGVFRGSALGQGVAQTMLLLPFDSARISVGGRVRSNAVFELNLYDPNAFRYSGTSSVGRLHFGRMENSAPTDWIELSTRDSMGERVYDVRFDSGPQDVMLRLQKEQLTATVESADWQRALRKTLNPEDPPASVYVGFGSGVNNNIAVHRLSVTGRIRLDRVETHVLTGLGDAFWQEGRHIRLIYNAHGLAHRIFVNGVPHLEMARTQNLILDQSTLFTTNVTLRSGDVLAFQIEGADDEFSLSVVGVDVATSCLVFATHPMVWRADSGEPSISWLQHWDAGGDNIARIGNGDHREMMSRFRQRLAVDFPGLPITQIPADGGRLALKYRVR